MTLTSHQLPCLPYSGQHFPCKLCHLSSPTWVFLAEQAQLFPQRLIASLHHEQHLTMWGSNRCSFALLVPSSGCTGVGFKRDTLSCSLWLNRVLKRAKLQHKCCFPSQSQKWHGQEKPLSQGKFIGNKLFWFPCSCFHFGSIVKPL